MHHLPNWIGHLSFKVLFLKCSGDDPAVSKKSRCWEKALEAPLRSFTDQIGIWCQQTEQPVFPSLFLKGMKDRGDYWGVALGFGICMALWNFLLWKASPALHKSPSYHQSTFCDDDGRDSNPDIHICNFNSCVPSIFSLCLRLWPFSCGPHLWYKRGKRSF